MNLEEKRHYDTSDISDIKSFGDNLLTDFFLFLDVSEKTMTTYRRALKQLFTFLYSNNISKPTFDDILLFKKTLEARNCKSATIALYLAATRRFFSWCEQKSIFPNVAVGVKAPRKRTQERLPWRKAVKAGAEHNRT